MKVSVPASLDRFIQDQVASGRFRTASEVVQEGLRLLRLEGQLRLLEKWLFEGLTDEEAAQLPAERFARFREGVRKLVEAHLKEARAEHELDSPSSTQMRTRAEVPPAWTRSYLLTGRAENDLTRILREVTEEEGRERALQVQELLRESFEQLASDPAMGRVREDMAGTTVRWWTVSSFLVGYEAECCPIEIFTLMNRKGGTWRTWSRTVS